MMMARPTAASAAAWVMMKIANSWPASSWLVWMYLAKATNSRLTPLSISSMDSKMPMALRRERTPYMPKLKRMEPRTRKWRRPGIRNSIALLFAGNHDRPNQRHGQQQRGNLKGQHVARHHQTADGLRR